MNASRPNPLISALVGAVLCLPFAAIVSMALLDLNPSAEPLRTLLNPSDPASPAGLSTLIALGAFLLVIVVFGINLSHVLRSGRPGEQVTAHPVNLGLAAVTLVAIVAVIGLFVADQYPCWVGVPNCD